VKADCTIPSASHWQRRCSNRCVPKGACCSKRWCCWVACSKAAAADLVYVVFVDYIVPVVIFLTRAPVHCLVIVGIVVDAAAVDNSVVVAAVVVVGSYVAGVAVGKSWDCLCPWGVMNALALRTFADLRKFDNRAGCSRTEMLAKIEGRKHVQFNLRANKTTPHTQKTPPPPEVL
jgi:hypothetical protein